MNKINAKELFFLAFGIVIISNIIILLGVYQNRLGKPTSMVTLSERELPIPRSNRDIKDRHLTLRWETTNKNGYFYSSQVNWLDEKKLQTLGFDIQRAKENKKSIKSMSVLKSSL